MVDETVMIEADTTEPGVLPWFKFWGNRWMSSSNVNGMTLTQQAIYVRVLCGIHMYGKLPRDPWQLSKLIGTPYKSTALWMQSYSHLTVDAQSNDSENAEDGKSDGTYFTVPKMEELQELSRKSSADRAGDKKRIEQSRPDSYSAPGGADKKSSPRAKRLKPDPDCPRCYGDGYIDIPAQPDRPEMSWNTIAQECTCKMPTDAQ
jgi:hypothetical protein